MKTVSAAVLQNLVARACEQMGTRQEDAAHVAASLVGANLCGVDSHGVFRLVQYHEWWKKGLLRPAARPTIAQEMPFGARIDGHWAFGQVVGRFATEVAVKKACQSQVAVVTAARSNHLGRLYDYAASIQQAGLVGLVMANDAGAGQAVVPWGGVKPRLSTNPMAMAIPGRTGGGILFDFSTSAAASGKVRQFLLKGEAVPPGWLIDAAGKETTDPIALFAEPLGALLPFGGHKGYALSLVVECLAGILSGAGFPGPNPGPEELNGVFILALDVAGFLPREQFYAQVDELTAYVKTSPSLPGRPAVRIPGEGDRAAAERGAREGIRLSDKAWEALSGVLRELGVPADGN